jgi:NAD(P)-dependent dehydrogenase (short-subunit alcohol dehydrogenase family)
LARLEGKKTIVTGAASGIGRATAKLFASEGADVLAVDLAAEVSDTAAAINDAGGTAIAMQADAGDDEAVKSVVARALLEFGGLDAAYANAGIIGPVGPLFEQQAEDWLNLLRVNLVSGFLMLKHAGKHMADQGKGSIILTASVAGLRANAGPLAYSASKAGVINMAQTASHEFLGTGVRVNAICPGLIETGMTKPTFDGARERGSEHKIGQLNPLQRGGQPNEIANMALFLASDDASYVNGQAIPVDGGLSSSLPFVPSGRRHR